MLLGEESCTEIKGINAEKELTRINRAIVRKPSLLGLFWPNKMRAKQRHVVLA